MASPKNLETPTSRFASSLVPLSVFVGAELKACAVDMIHNQLNFTMVSCILWLMVEVEDIKHSMETSCQERIPNGTKRQSTFSEPAGNIRAAIKWGWRPHFTLLNCRPTMMFTTEFPELPLLSLDTAEELTTLLAVKGKNTVIGEFSSVCSV